MERSFPELMHYKRDHNNAKEDKREARSSLKRVTGGPDISRQQLIWAENSKQQTEPQSSPFLHGR